MVNLRDLLKFPTPGESASTNLTSTPQTIPTTNVMATNSPQAIRSTTTCNEVEGVREKTNLRSEQTNLDGPMLSIQGASSLADDQGPAKELKQVEFNNAVNPTIAAEVSMVADTMLATPTQPKTTQSLARYRPIQNIPPYQEPASATFKHPPLSKYQLPANQWPQFYQFWSKKINDKADLPPKTAPFHEQVQHYVQRWAVWVCTVSERERREELIKWVTEKMENAWRHGIDKGLYPRSGFPEHGNDGVGEGGTALSSSQIGDQINGIARGYKTGEKQRKKPRVGPDDTWLFTDGLAAAPTRGKTRDKNTRVYESEIVAAGVSLAAVQARVASQDFEGGEELLETTTAALGRDIGASDWNGKGPSVPGNPKGRDLLLYSLNEVQNAKAEKIHLQRLMRSFKGHHQKQNTFNRIDEQTYRENQFLALAIEINNNRAEETDTSDEESSDGDEILESTKAITPEDSEKEFTGLTSDDHAPVFVPTNEEANLIALAKQVLAEPDNQRMMSVFQSGNFTESGLRGQFLNSYQESGSISKVRIYLLQILRKINRQLSLRLQIQNTSREVEKRGLNEEITNIENEISLDKGALRAELVKLRSPLDTISPSPQTTAVVENNGVNIMQVVGQDGDATVSQKSHDLTQMTLAAEEVPKHSTKPVQGDEGMRTRHSILDPDGTSEAPRASKELDDGSLSTQMVHASHDGTTGPSPSLEPPETEKTASGKLLAEHRRSESRSKSPSARLPAPMTNKRQQYRQHILFPKINKLFRGLGIREVPAKLTNWRGIEERLNDVIDFEDEKRERFKNDFFKGHETWDGITTPDSGVGKDFPKTFTDAVESDRDKTTVATPDQRRRTSMNEKVSTTTSSDQQKGKRKVLNLLPPKNSAKRLRFTKLSKVVTLYIRPGFDPADPLFDMSIKSYKTFNFRFTPISTLQERESIHDAVREYARGKSLGETFRNSAYQQFAAPGGKLVAHGYWDGKGGERAKDSDWFFDNNFTFDEYGGVVREDGGIIGIVREEPPARRGKATRKRKALRYDEGDDESDDEWVG